MHASLPWCVFLQLSCMANSLSIKHYIHPNSVILVQNHLYCQQKIKKLNNWKIEEKNWERRKTGYRERKQSIQSWTKRCKRNAKITKEMDRLCWNYISKWKRTKTYIQRRTFEKDMWNEEKEVQMDRNEILKVFACFYTELYSSTLQDQHPSLKITNPDSSEVPPVMTSEVKRTLKEMKNKAPDIDNLTSDIMILGGEESVKQIKNFNQILETKKDTSWMERSQDDNTRQKRRCERHQKLQAHKSTFPHEQTVHMDITKKNGKGSGWKPSKRTGCFRKGYSTIDHPHTINQPIENCNEFKRPLCTGYIDCEKAFDSIEHEAIFKALRSIGINETYITILEDTYTGAITRVHIWTIKSQKKYQY